MTLHARRRAAAAFLPLLFAPAPAAAQALTEAQQLAFDALKLDFVREEVTAPEVEIAGRFKQACDLGYQLACERKTWWTSGRADVQAASRTMEKACDNGDRVACMVVAWAIEASAPKSAEPDRSWRAGARILLQHCEGGFAPACHEYAFYLLEQRVKADPRAAYLRWKPACDKGYLPSCATLGILELEGAPGLPKNPRKALASLDATCKKGSAAACFAWGEASDASWTTDRFHAFYDGLCAEGHRESCWRLGLAYQNNVHPPSSPDAARTLMERGCALGHAESCYEAARGATAGEAPDWDKARTWFTEACNHGDTDGCKELVDLFVEGRVAGNLRSDPHAFELACEQEGHVEACNRLAVGLLAGVDLPRDPTRARRLLSRTCVDANSSPEACAKLGQTFEEGLGGDRDRTEASKFYRWACYGGRFDACERRGDLLASGSGIVRDDHEALAMYERACDGGLATACFKGGAILDQATFVTRDVRRAADAYETACEGGVVVGCAALGRLQEQGVDGGPDFEAARGSYERAIALDDAESRRRLARLLWNGLGGRRDKKRARSLSSEACQKGDPIACRGPEFL